MEVEKVKGEVYSSRELDQAEGGGINSLRARSQEAMPDPDKWLERRVSKNILITSVDALLNWGRHYSTWPVNLGLACCAFEMMAVAISRYDISRFGMELFRASPRQADLMIVSGTLTWKMAPQLLRVYDQMPEPKWVLAMGACAISGGTFAGSYSVVPGVNRIMPVDVYVPGCPPKPEGLLHGIMMLHKKVTSRSITEDVPFLKGISR